MTKQPKPLIECIYCGLNKPSTDEHIVQRALGGTSVLSDVCSDCNSSFSEIDDALAVKSPLSILCRRELNHTGPATAWDVAEDRNGLLLESRQTYGTDSMTVLPQVIFDGKDELFYDDNDELQSLGDARVQHEFFSRLKSAVQLYDIVGPNARKRDHKGKDMLKLERNKIVRNGYRYPPRVCTPYNVVEYKKEVTFLLRYYDETDIEVALQALRKLKWDTPANKTHIQLGTRMPEIHISFIPELIIRGITKLGFNLLARFCTATAPSLKTFGPAIDWIMRRRYSVLFGNHNSYGFVKPADIGVLACPPKAHKFRLTYDAEISRWKMYCAFFGGQAGSFVSIFEPNNESWNTVEVVAPLGKHLCTPNFGTAYQPLEVNIALAGPDILPGTRLTNGEIRIRRERLRK